MFVLGPLVLPPLLLLLLPGNSAGGSEPHLRRGAVVSVASRLAVVVVEDRHSHSHASSSTHTCGVRASLQGSSRSSRQAPSSKPSAAAEGNDLHSPVPLSACRCCCGSCCGCGCLCCCGCCCGPCLLRPPPLLPPLPAMPVSGVVCWVRRRETLWVAGWESLKSEVLESTNQHPTGTHSPTRQNPSARFCSMRRRCAACSPSPTHFFFLLPLGSINEDRTLATNQGSPHTHPKQSFQQSIPCSD